VGIAIAFLLSALLCAITIMARPIIALYCILFIVIFFEEFGVGFTSTTGSIFFNSDFLNLFKFKIIEVIIGSVYFFILITSKRKIRGSFSPLEKNIFIAFVIVVLFVCSIELSRHGTVTVGGIRQIVPGIMLFHMYYLAINTEGEFLQFVKVLIIMLSIRAFIGLVMLGVGHGIESPRGAVPFFWDSRQIDAFAFGVILLSGYIAQYSKIDLSHRLFSRSLAILFLCVLGFAVLLSFRRTVWFMAAVGIFFVMLSSRKVKIYHYVILAGVMTLVFVMVFSVPAFKDTRDRIIFYVEHSNIFNKDVAKQQENAAHIDNLKQYYRIITEDKNILFMGFRGRVDSNYTEFESKKGMGPLGTAHNGLLVTTLFFGLGGLILYLVFFLFPLFKYRILYKQPDTSPVRYIGLGALIFFFLEFIPSLTFSPAFYTSVKGGFYVFTALFIVRSAVYYGNKPPSTKEISGRKEPIVPVKNRVILAKSRVINSK